ncbi:MAG: translational GTPase TypA [Chloroflexi bacterium]|nr:translational GTPase TypA [Chloroflexota bacterium]
MSRTTEAPRRARTCNLSGLPFETPTHRTLHRDDCREPVQPGPDAETCCGEHVNYRKDIRNVAIIAHVDHGKTTLVDAMLKQSNVFKNNDKVGELVMDQNALERERGITILSKNTAIIYKGVKINIIDTPGHADFGGEVERVISMADGCLLLVDSFEGPMPQTIFVLRHALKRGLVPIVVINKTDRKNARISEVLHLTQDLFLELATTAEQLDFPVLYASAKQGIVSTEPGVSGSNVAPLLDSILETVPPPRIETGPFQMLVSNLDYDNHKGKIAIGRIWRGKVAPRDQLVSIDAACDTSSFQVAEVFTYLGLARLEVNEAEAGDIVALTGIKKASIGDTISSPEQIEALPRIEIGEPTVEMTFGVNTSPFGGREGTYCTTRHLRDRLYRELETNLSLRVQDTDTADTFLVKGRGELHLSILIETMRREGYEFELSKPEAITRVVDGTLMEPVEDLLIDTKEGYIGILTEMLSNRQAELKDMHNDGEGNIRLEFRIPTKGLIGFRSSFMTATRGDGIMNTTHIGYRPWRRDPVSSRSGVLVASEQGKVTAFGIENAQGRGLTFVEPGTLAYEGMIVGTNPRTRDIAVNVCKEKKKTNMRSSTADIATKLAPPIELSLEQSIDFIAQDELIEVTPENIRLRKKLLTQTQRLRAYASARKDMDA